MLLASIYLEGKSGHAINILDAKDGIYVFDDDTVVKPLKEYLNDLGEKFIRLTINDFDKEFADLLPRTGFKHEARIHKVSITNWKHEDDAKYLLEVQRGVLLDSQNANYEFNGAGAMTGGSPVEFVVYSFFFQELPQHVKILVWVVNSLLLSLIVIIIVMKVIKAKNNKEIQRIQRKIRKASGQAKQFVDKQISMKIENDVEEEVEKATPSPIKYNKALMRVKSLVDWM
jgi:hypothetical protein